MNYQKIHDSIIERAKLRNLEAGVYYEKHHILARSVGGGNDAENLVLLTAKEHFVIHRLLFQVDSYTNAMNTIKRIGGSISIIKTNVSSFFSCLHVN